MRLLKQRFYPFGWKIPIKWIHIFWWKVLVGLTTPHHFPSEGAARLHIERWFIYRYRRRRESLINRYLRSHQIVDGRLLLLGRRENAFLRTLLGIWDNERKNQVSRGRRRRGLTTTEELFSKQSKSIFTCGWASHLHKKICTDHEIFPCGSTRSKKERIFACGCLRGQLRGPSAKIDFYMCSS